MTRNIFREEKLNTILNKRGYLKFELPNPDVIDQIKDVVAHFNYGSINGQKSVESYFAEYEIRADILKSLKPYFEEEQAKIFEDMTIYMINVFRKEPMGKATDFHWHSSVVDEQASQTLTLWMPLHDVSRNGSTLGFVPGSHKITGDLRVTRHFEFKDLADRTIKDYMVYEDIKKGECFIFYDSILHWGAPNHTNKTRTAIKFGLKRPDAQFEYHHQVDDHYANKYVSTDEFEMLKVIAAKEPDDINAVEKISNERVFASMEQFKQRLREANPEIKYPVLWNRIRNSMRPNRYFGE
jgi:hypothetical protein